MTDGELAAAARPELRLRTCPQCQQQIEFDPSFPVWCPACEWNVAPAAARRRPRGRRALRERRLAQRVYAQVHRAGPGGRSGRGAAMAWLLAACIHGLTLGTAALAVLLIAPGSGLALPVRVVGAGLLAGIALYVQPFGWPRPLRRLRRRHPAGRATGLVLDPASAPELFALLADVAAALSAPAAASVPAVAAVHLGPEFNAAYFRDRRGPVIRLGLSLWSILTAQERVALLAHELGHGVNGDVRRTAFVGTAITSLERWRQLLEPRLFRAGRSAGGVNGAGGLASFAEGLVPLILLPFALTVEAAGILLVRLANGQGQRSEYYADQLAAAAAGSAAAITLLDKLLLAGGCEFTIRQLRQYRHDADFWRELSMFAASVPELEWQRLAKLSVRDLDGIDTAHPPTALRATLLREQPARSAVVTLDSARSARIDSELAEPAARIAARLRS
jgi:Zn-dependent protease with chaperone function